MLLIHAILILLHIYSLYARAKFMGFMRSRHVQKVQTSLLQLDGVKTKADTDFYLGKRVCYVYKVIFSNFLNYILQGFFN